MYACMSIGYACKFIGFIYIYNLYCNLYLCVCVVCPEIRQYIIIVMKTNIFLYISHVIRSFDKYMTLNGLQC